MKAIEKFPAGKTAAVFARCGECDWRWPVAWLPMTVEEFTNVAKGAHCPFCASSRVFCA